LTGILIEMTGELGRDWSLPLLPAGATIFDALPFDALVLDALAPAVGNGVITLRDAGQEGVVVVRDGVMSESVWVADGARATGDAALKQIRLAEGAAVSACRLSDDLMGLIGPLIRGEPCYGDLRLEWVVWPKLLSDLRERAGTFVVELTTPMGRAVTVVEKGRQTATFAESQPALGGSDLVDALAAGGVGSIRVLVDRDGRSATPSGSSWVAAPKVTAPGNGDPQRGYASHHLNRPSALDDDPNATLTALFGSRRDGVVAYPQTNADRSESRESTPVESMLPELKLLVRNRLQRSSASVEEVVDVAATDRQSVEWLADRVRAMTVRGFLHSTLDQLADDMILLTRRQPD